MARTVCSTPGCDQDAAWGARSKPAWCQEHAREQFRTAGLDPQEQIDKATTFTLVTCQTCGTQTHVKLEYALTKSHSGEPACRACYWRGWAQHARSALGEPDALEDVAQVKAVAQKNGYEYLGPLTSPSRKDDPHHVRCLDCSRMSAQRRGDIGWGCQCQKVSKTSARGRKETPQLFKDSHSPAVAMWDHTRNSAADWDTASVAARRSVHWLCPRCGHRFTASIREVTAGRGCEICWRGSDVTSASEQERYAGAAIADVPDLADAWAGEGDPGRVLVLDPSGAATAFRCVQGHHERVHPLVRLRFGCGVCRSEQIDAKIQELQAGFAAMPQETTRLHPEMAAQWHPEANTRVTLETISPNSKKDVTWQCQQCNHEWVESPKSRSYADARLCPRCRSVFGSLAHVIPDLALEWSPSNPRTAWQVRPYAATAFLPEWICSIDPTHTFTAPVSSRANGAGCPECSTHGKSRIEVDHHEAATRILGPARSGTAVRIRHGRTWRVDITLETDQVRLAIEYDGAYWHRDKSEIDTRKSRDLLAEGWSLVRLREHPLEPLPIRDPRYLELTVYATAPDPQAVMRQINEWVTSSLPPRTHPG